MKTYRVKADEIERNWYLIDAENKVLGRLASEIAQILRGKHKVKYSPHLDTGDFVVLINAAKVRVSGRKIEQKTYFRHSGYPGGKRNVPIIEVLQQHPERVIRDAVKGMLPKTKLGRRQMKKLKIYAGPEHPHEAQQPEKLDI